MKTTTLGRGGSTTPAIGLGCMGLSQGYGPADDEESIATIGRAIEASTVSVDVGPGKVMAGYLAQPAAPGRHLGVVVGMELFGLSDHVREVCRSLAADGFIALAPDLNHRTAPASVLAENAAGRARGLELLAQQTRQQALDDVGAAIDHLRAAGSPVVGMVGLSVGGHVAYLAATALDLPAVAVFYGGWLPTTDIPLSRPEPTLERTPRITGRVLYLVGSQDHVVPPRHQQAIAGALRDAGARHEMVTYPGVGHGFLDPRRATYDHHAADDAWQRTIRLLADQGSEPAP